MTSVAATQFLPVVATAGSTRNSLVVSIHDVAPSTRGTTEKIISELAQRGVRACSLLVVPNYHHLGSFAEDRQLVSWLRDLEAQGHEIVIHGYFHERPRRLNESFSDQFVTQFYTQGEGEFYDLSYDEAFQRITRARDEFRQAGFSPRGFVAPAWLLNAEGTRAARDAEMEYTTRLSNVQDLRSNEIFAARSLVYSVRSPWRRVTSLAWNATLAKLMKENQLVRLSIHPPDYIYPAIWRQIGDLISAMDGVRTSTTYQDWIGEQRTRRAAN
jgi:predicted deacetylase